MEVMQHEKSDYCVEPAAKFRRQVQNVGAMQRDIVAAAAGFPQPVEKERRKGHPPHVNPPWGDIKRIASHAAPHLNHLVSALDVREPHEFVNMPEEVGRGRGDHSLFDCSTEIVNLRAVMVLEFFFRPVHMPTAYIMKISLETQ